MYIFTFEINGYYFGIPIKDVAFIESRWDSITGASSTSEYIKESILLHGMVVPIYDLASQLGYTEQQMKYVVALNVKGAMLGLAINGTGDVISIDESMIYQVPAVINAAQHYVKNMVFYQEKLIALIDVDYLIPPDTGYSKGIENGA